MAYFQTKKVKVIPPPIPDEPGYIPPTPPTPPTPGEGTAPDIVRPGLTTSGVMTLYKVSDDNSVVDKTLNNAYPINITFTRDIDIMNPIILIEGNVNISFYNYAYIDVLGRYYYISAVNASPGNHFEIMMHIDVLKTYSASIKNVIGVISRQENEYNLYLPDPEFKVYANTDKKTLKFSKNPFTKSANFLLTVSGGV